QRMELGAQCALDAFARLVAGPQRVAERLDDVIGGDGDVRRAVFQQLQRPVQDADHGAEGTVLAFGETAQAVEMPEQFVGAVDEVEDHAPKILQRAGTQCCVTTMGAPLVMIIVCSYCADRFPATPASVQPSEVSLTVRLFVDRNGSMVITMPSCSVRLSDGSK